MITSEIRVNTIFPSTLDTREGAALLAQLIREQLADNTIVDVDFKDIIFMSRSFADQFHKDIMAGDSVDIVIKNADLGIIEMLKAVSQTQNKRKPVKKSYQVLSFNNLDMLSDYSFAW